MGNPAHMAPRHCPAEVFKALGHPGRVVIVRELTTGEKCVCDLVNAVGLG